MAPRPSSNGRQLRHVLAALSTAGLAAVAAACGSSSTGRATQSAAPLLQQSAAAFANVPTVHIKGAIVEKSSSGADSITVDATSAGVTGTSEGTLGLEGPGLGFVGSTRYIVVGGITYVNAGTPFWKSLFGKQTSVAVRLENEILPEVLNRWVELPASSTDVIYKDTFGLSEPKVFVEGTLAGAKGTLSNDGNQTVDGVSGVQISSSTGAKILVTTSGPALPLAVSKTQSGAAGLRVNLSVSYPTVARISAPAPVVSLAAIEAAVSK